MDEIDTTNTPELLVDFYEVDGVNHASTLAQDLKIDRTNLSEEYASHSTKYAWYSTAYELALDYEQRCKAKLARVYAQEDVKARANMKAASVRVTEKKVENTVITSVAYVQAENEYFEAKKQTGLLKAARDAMIHRKDCLISLGANLRAEMASDPSLRQEQYIKQYGSNNVKGK